MTRQDFNQQYIVEPVFEKTRVLFYVYKNNKVDFITPAIDIQKAFNLDCIDDGAVCKIVACLADSFICKKYEIVD